MSLISKIIIFLFIVLSVIVGVIGFLNFRRNIFSKEAVKIEILGPREVKAMEEYEYRIRWSNNGNITLEDVVLIVEFPEHSILAQGKPLRIEKEIADIFPGQEETLTFRAMLTGKQNEIKEIRAFLSFRPRNIQARFESSTRHTTIIDFVPFVFEIDMPSRVEDAREFQISLNYFSNIDYIFEDVRIILEHPEDFQFIRSDPEAIDETEWRLGSVSKGEGREITIQGKIDSVPGREKTFGAKLGLWKEGEFVLLREATRRIEIVSPFLRITQFINGSDYYIATPGDLLHYEIFLRNVGEKPFEDLFISIELDGPAFDFETLRTHRGDFEKGHNVIVWDRRIAPELGFLAAGEEIELEFWIQLKDEWPFRGARDKNPVLTTKIDLLGLREEIITKVDSKIIVLQESAFECLVFDNKGPIPPQKGQETFYTISWQVKNFHSDINDIKISAILLDEVRPTGNIYPKEARFTFDSETREIVWRIDSLLAGEGKIGEEIKMYFQVILTPEQEVRDEPIILVNPAIISAEDQWTGNVIKSTTPAVYNILIDDELIEEENE